MLCSADYLLPDEATSNLDATSTALVTEAMDRLMMDRTTGHGSAHSYEAAKRADYVIVMRDGAVEAAGTPDGAAREQCILSNVQQITLMSAREP